MFEMLNNKIRKSFSETADQYDILASLHREIGRELILKLTKIPKVDAVLDVGCGTGYLTGKARYFFPDARVVGLDFAEGMLKVAQEKHENIEWVLADAQELSFADASFDIVISNLAYQWVADLPKAFGHVHRVLAPEGTFACTLFGFHTCDELFQSFDLASEGKLKFTRLPQLPEVEEALKQAGFVEPKVDYERIKVQFNDMKDLTNWLKSIGANNLPREGYAGKEVMARAAAIYQEKFPYHHGVCATFEVIWVHAQK